MSEVWNYTGVMGNVHLYIILLSKTDPTISVWDEFVLVFVFWSLLKM